MPPSRATVVGQRPTEPSGSLNQLSAALGSPIFTIGAAILSSRRPLPCEISADVAWMLAVQHQCIIAQALGPRGASTMPPAPRPSPAPPHKPRAPPAVLSNQRAADAAQHVNVPTNRRLGRCRPPPRARPRRANLEREGSDGQDSTIIDTARDVTASPNWTCKAG
ncbi:hypothetical protein GGTG_09210 [Gaeumannomyces tritici R3-111a-1]|uniref:Uncharacterized protein n=1 Tax=Gaeumannomyces tritici (strain R3-111a-1) TaxID=644352 RepID=J3P6R8_GAET3|nr:hypothetical protein GGTG_09210 [Gaeumannomyces tritici R3-111a-1]EJT72344.1 hypothetical protein GGTG_09210 [Gaeumannomyces tritici R3-111a-1]